MIYAESESLFDEFSSDDYLKRFALDAVCSEGYKVVAKRSRIDDRMMDGNGSKEGSLR